MTHRSPVCENRILNALSQPGTTKDICERTGYTYNTVSSFKRLLYQEGKIKEVLVTDQRFRKYVATGVVK
jgi:hypothetical protein